MSQLQGLAGDKEQHRTYFELLSPLYCAMARTASIPFSCATAFASVTHFFLSYQYWSELRPQRTDSNGPSDVYARKKGSASEAVFADLAMTSVYADNLAFQF